MWALIAIYRWGNRAHTDKVTYQRIIPLEFAWLSHPLVCPFGLSVLGRLTIQGWHIDHLIRVTEAQTAVSVFQVALVGTTPEATLTSHWAPGTSPAIHVWHWAFAKILSCAWDLCAGLRSLPPFVVTLQIFWYFSFCSRPVFFTLFPN